MTLNAPLTDSQFNMWRAVFAYAHLDHKVDDEEIAFMARALEILPLNSEQKEQLERDIHVPRNIENLFEKITDQNDRADFFHYARMISWCDGDYSKQEQEITEKLRAIHADTLDWDKMVGEVQLQLEDEEGPTLEDQYAELSERGRKGIMESIADHYQTMHKKKRV